MGGLSLSTDEEGLRDHFEQYGKVKEAEVLLDKKNEYKPRGFGFITFESAESMRECLTLPHNIDGKDVSWFLGLRVASNATFSVCGGSTGLMRSHSNLLPMALL